MAVSSVIGPAQNVNMGGRRSSYSLGAAGGGRCLHA